MSWLAGPQAHGRQRQIFQGHQGPPLKGRPVRPLLTGGDTPSGSRLSTADLEAVGLAEHAGSPRSFGGRAVSQSS